MKSSFMEHSPPLVVLLGGSGYIGTHLMLALHGKYQIAIIDRQSPSEEAVNYVEERNGGLPVLRYIVDLEMSPHEGDYPGLPRTPYCGIMLAALKDVNEGEKIPYDYIRTNLSICVNSMEYLAMLNVTRLIQASSSTLYHNDRPGGEPVGVYGYTKRVSEDICKRLLKPDQKLLISRYMNPIGSHPHVNAFADIGVCQKLVKMKPEEIFMNRGDCIRDYIHITDLADFHLEALNSWDLLFGDDNNIILDVGTGIRTTVSQLVEEFNTHLPRGSHKIPITLVERLKHEGYDTTSTSDEVRKRLPSWWNKPKIGICTAVQDYRRQGI